MRIAVKPYVIVVYTPTIIHIIEKWIDACERAVSMKYLPTITSQLDGIHVDGSGHPEGRAIDFRSHDVEYPLRTNLKVTAQELLGSNYLVLLNDTHYHIQRQKYSTEQEAGTVNV